MTGVRSPGRWWRGKSTPAKVEAYTRSCYYFIPAAGVLTYGPAGFGEVPFSVATALLLIVAAHALLCAATVPAALDHVLGRRSGSARRVVVLAVATPAAAVTALALAVHGPGGGSEHAGARMYVGLLSFGFGVVALGVRRATLLPALAAAVAGAATPVCLLLGLPAAEALVTGLAVLIGGGFLALTSGFSVWLLRAVYALDEARETRARLAVAEERLRFGRDLHDILGRNLSVIALKSELAVQLAHRARPEAVEQMIEVQRIAQESQREVREVVRGYRDVAVDTELTGAQGVLTAAGIDCSVTGTETGGTLPGEARSALGWVVREAATNVLRHGDARTCAIALTVDGDRATLVVENDGVVWSDGAAGDEGARGEAARGEAARGEARPTGSANGSGPTGFKGGSGPAGFAGGSGLAGLRERLGVLGGSLAAGPAAGGRFRVVAEVPVRGPGAGDEAGSGDGEEAA